MNVLCCKDKITSYLEANLSLVEGFQRTIETHSGAGMIHVSGDGNENFENYRQLLTRAARVLTGLRAEGLQPGDKLLLQTDRSDDFVAAFWGCFLGGIVPVPLSVPASYRANDQEYRKFFNVYQLLEAPLIACEKNLDSELQQLAAERIDGLRHIVIGDLQKNEPATDFHKADPDDLAFLMFSSGSTGLPKGVCLSHRNLLHNIRQIAQRGALNEKDISVSWLPFSHDMGLILFHLTHTLCGITQIKMGNFTFIRKPEIYLQKMANYRATITGCPNFAFYHLTHEVDDSVLADLDLSNLRILYNGAEPISADVCRDFLDRYCPKTNLSRSVIFPGYGIAEACVCATVHEWDTELSAEACPTISIDSQTFSVEQKVVAPKGDAKPMEIVNLGEPMPDMTARIVDENNQPMGERSVGRIQFQGPNVSQGYYNNPSANADLFVDGWLDTGDLGFIDQGYVYITGRAKDIIFVNGQNFYAHDIESVLIEKCDMGLGQVAVAGYTRDGVERIAVFFMHRRKVETSVDKIREIRQAISDNFKFDVHTVLPVRKIPKTTSGKLQRFQLVKDLLDGRFQKAESTLASVITHEFRACRNDLEKQLAQVTAQRFGLECDKVSIDVPFVEIANDSIQMVRLLDDFKASNVHPAVSATVIAELYTHNTIAKFATFLQEKATASDTELVLPTVEGPRYELSHAQKQVYVATRLNDKTTVYSEAYACDIQGEVDANLLEQAFQSLITKFSSLRTAFGEEDGVPYQVINDEVIFKLQTRDLRGMDAEDASTELENSMMADAAKPIQLSNAPLLRACLYQTSDDAFTLYLNLHHIVIDGSGFSILFSELSSAYAALTEGKALTEIEKARPVDYYNWHNEQLKSEKGQQAGDYWVDLFKDPAPRVELAPTREEDENAGAGVFSLALDEAQLASLEKAAEKNNWTFYQICMSAYLLLVNRLSGQEDITVGTTASGRMHPQSGDMLGYLANTLAVRLNVNSAATLGEMVDSVKAQVQETFQYSEFPIDLFYRRIKPHAHLKGSPLFTTVFSMFESPRESSESLRFNNIRFLRHEAKVDVLLNVEKMDGSLNFNWEFNKGKYGEEDIANWHGTLVSLIERICAEPARPAISVHLNSEDYQVARSLYQVPADGPAYATFNEYLNAQYMANPNNAALSYGDTVLTYAQLEERTRRMGHLLRSQGAVPGDFVAILLPKGIDLVVSALAAIRSGAAYTPVDTDYPSSRIQDILLRSDAKWVVTSDAHLAGVAETLGADTTVICIDETTVKGAFNLCDTAAQKAIEVPAKLPNVNTASDPVYMHFTSGSTGTPKGVVNDHAAIVSLIEWYLRDDIYRAGDTIPQLPSFAFEAAAGEVYPALAAGARLHVFPSLKGLLPEDLLEELIKVDTAVMTISPSYFRSLAKYIDADKLKAWSSLRQVYFGGEPIKPTDVAFFQETLGSGVELVNAYGPTETTVHATAYQIPSDFDAELGSVSIGKPIFGKRILVLNSSDQLCEIGEVGELCIAGAGLAMGYYKDAEKTEAAFSHICLNDQETVRIYRTGDLGAITADGNLDIRGRKDSQVKIRGNRVELGEVEVALSRIEGISETAVLAVDAGTGNGRLVAYYSGQDIDSNVLTAKLGESLPNYMVPSLFVHMAALPKSHNEKIDRKALATLPLPKTVAKTTSAAAAVGGTEAIVADAWKEILKLDDVGADDNFFAIGGDSILSLEVVSMLSRQGFGVKPADMFNHQTVRELAAFLETKRVNANLEEDKPVNGPVGLTPIQSWFFSNNYANENFWLQSLEAEMNEAIDASRLKEAITHLVAFHDGLRSMFRRDRHGLNQIIRESHENWPFVEADLRDGEESLEAFALRIREQVDLKKSLFAVGLARTGEASYRLVWAAHHLIVDTVSWRILFTDLSLAYTSLGNGETPDLGRRSTSYQAWSNWLLAEADWDAKEKDLQKEYDYWKPFLESPTHRFSLKPEVNVSQMPMHTYHSVAVSLDASVTDQLLVDAHRRYNTTIMDLLLAGLYRGLANWSGNPQVTVDLESHGRNIEADGIDLGRTTGWFTALYPFHATVETDEDPGITVVGIKERRARVPRDGMGFGLLRYLCTNDDIYDAFSTYLNQDVNFNYLGQLDRTGDDSTWQITTPSAMDFDKNNHAPYKLVITAYVREGQLHLECAAGEALLSKEELEAMANAVTGQLNNVVAHCMGSTRRTFTPSDFPLAKLTQKDIDHLPAETEDVYPMSPMQEGMFFYCVTNPDGALYHEQTVYSYGKSLQVEVLAEAMTQMVARHEILRSIYVMEKFSKPLQIMLAPFEPEVRCTDLETLDERGRQDALDAYLTYDREHQRFDPTKAPLFRLEVFRLGDADWRIIFSFHHIILDGWSQSSLMSELFTRYDALVDGQPMDAAPLNTRFSDFLERLDQETSTDDAAAFWSEKMAYPTYNELPLDQARPETRSVVGRHQNVWLEQEVTDRLTELAKTYKVTLNEVCLAAYTYLLYTLSGDSDITTGVVTSGRFMDMPDAGKMLGCFLNTFPIRVNFEEEEVSFKDMIGYTHDFLREAKPFENYPLKDITRQVRNNGGEARDLFTNIYAFENYPTNTADEQGLKMVGGFDMTNYDLTAVIVKQESLYVMFEYAPDVFAPKTVARWVNQYAHLLDVLSRNPETKIDAIDLLPEEQKQVLARYNKTYRPYETNLTMHDLFYRQALATPDRNAIYCDGETMSYGQLREDSNRIAHALREHGAAPNELIVSVAYRRPKAVAGLMGILKSGGAYVPIDPAYPANRINLLSADCDAKIAVVDSASLAQGKFAFDELPELKTVLCLDEASDEARSQVPSGVKLLDRNDWTSYSADDMEAISKPDDLAYIIYTSGSTGKPKGVVIRHRNAVNTFFGVNETFSMTEDDRILCFSSFCFDLSVYDLFGTLAIGAEIVLATEDQIKNAEALMALVQERQVTVWDSVPTGMNQLVQTIKLNATHEQNESLRLVMLSGEFIPLSLPDEIRSIFPNTRITSLGGATEGTVWSIFYYPVTEVRETWKSIPYGWPLPNQGYYVLNSEMNHCLIDQPGMLYIVGGGVAKEYFKDEEKTNRAFVGDPFKGPLGETIYMTGDLGKMKAEGYIEILGRKDSQVKIRGFRIELGEVENQLGLHPQVEEAAVLALPGPDGQKRMEAFFTAVDDQITVEDLTRYLKEKLPAYMVPSLFHRLERLPVNNSGKIDRKRLPSMVESNRPELETEYTAPQSELEKTIAGVWQELLNVEQVGLDDNYFSMGGDSILSLQVAMRLGEAGVHIKPNNIFKNPTVAQLAAFVLAGGNGTAAVVNNDPVVGEVPTSPIWNWFFELPLENRNLWHLSLDLDVKQELNTDHFQKAVLAVYNQHDLLRTRFDANGNATTEPEATEFEVLVEDLSKQNADAQNARIKALGDQLRDDVELDKAPLMRVGLIRTEAERYHVILVVHHLLVDGVSWRILLEDLNRAYNALDQGEAVSFANKTHSYRDWSKYANSIGASEDFDAQLRPWQDVLRGKRFTLPTHGDAAQNIEDAVVYLETQVDEAITAQLVGSANECYNTGIQDLLLAGFFTALSRATGSKHVALDNERHGRNLVDEHMDISRTVGWFTSIYPINLELTSPNSIGETIVDVKEKWASIEQHTDTFPALRYGANSASLFADYRDQDVLFNYLGDLDKIQMDSTWGLGESSGFDHAVANRRTHLVDVGVSIRNKQLSVKLGYASKLLNTADMQALINGYVQALNEIVEHCSRTENRLRTPADFPLAEISREQAASLDNNVEDLYPLSAMQEGMYFYGKYHPSSPVYHVHGYCTVQMDLNRQLFEDAINAVAEQHPIMRTVFVSDGYKRPLQMVLRNVRYTVDIEDISRMSQARQERHIAKWHKSIASGEIDLSQFPLCHFRIFRNAKDVYTFGQFFHHMIFDGWSNGIFFTRTMDAYSQLKKGEEVQLAPPASPYRDFIAFQREMAEDEAGKSFWASQVEGAKVNQLPLDKPRRRHRDFRTEMSFFNLGEELTANLRNKAREMECTVSELLISAHFGLVGLLTGDEDVTIGYSMSVRPGSIPGIEQMTGMFLNTVPLRANVNPSAGLGQLVNSTRKVLLDSREYEAFPLTDILRRFRVEGGRPGRSLFNTLFTAENYPGPSIPSDVTPLGVHNWHMTEFDLAIVMSGETETDTHFKFAYANDILEEKTVTAWYGIFKEILERICENTSAPLATVIGDRCAAAPQVGGAPLFGDLFGAEASSNRIAVEAEGQVLTYQELDQKANQLAAVLQSEGLTSGDAVLARFEKSDPLLIVAITTCLRHGFTLVPLNAGLPEKELLRMREETNAKALVCDQTSIADSFAKGSGLDVVIASQTASFQTGETRFLSLVDLSYAEPVEPVRCNPEQAAYIIYTSASSGPAKGVSVSHAAVADMLDRYCGELELGSEDILSQVLSPGFDASLSEILPALAVGARVSLLPRLDRLSAGELMNYVARRKVSVLTLPAAWFKLVVEAAWGSKLPERFTPRLIVSGGERLEIETLRRWNKLSRVPVYNAYGATETTIVASTYKLDHATIRQLLRERRSRNSAPIGALGGNIKLLNNRLQPCAVGETGEIFVAGESVAMGYLNAEQAQGKRFMEKDGINLFRTGDRAIRRADDTIEFVGREDRLVKVRGNRINLDAVDQALKDLPGIRDAYTTPLFRNGRTVLVAFYTGDQNFPAQNLGSLLAKHLEPAAIPSQMEWVDNIPMNASGKTDQATLLATYYRSSNPEQGLPSRSFWVRLFQKFRGIKPLPVDRLERDLLQIWGKQLDIEGLTRDADVFALGCDSLIAARATDAIRKQIGLNVGAEVIFENPTIAAQATALCRLSLNP